MRLLNPGNSKMTLHQGSVIATLEPVPPPFVPDGIDSIQRGEEYISPEARWDENLPDPPTEKDTAKFLMEKLDLTDTSLSEDAQHKLRHIILENSKAFVGPDGVIGCTTGKCATG